MTQLEFDSPSQPGLAAPPLAELLRPKSLEDVVGQEVLLGPEGRLRRMLAAGDLASIIFWGPPGTGKTTIARLLAAEVGMALEPVSAVFDGVADLRKVFARAAERQAGGERTLLFVDEVHRFNKAQQDGLLPWVEDGTVTLVGATTENPSFALNGALLYWEKHPDRFCFDAELAQLQAAHPGLQLRRFCNAAEPVDGLRRGRFDAAMAGALRDEFPAAAVLACGGSAFVDAVRQELATAPGGFSAEAFTPPSSPHVVDGEETFFDLVLQRSNRRLRVSSRQPLLVALEEAGMSPPHGCRMGICNSCSCQQRRGETVNDVNGARLQGGGAVRLCVSRASSDLELEL